MRLQRVAVAAVAAAVLGSTLLSSSDSTRANWREELTVSVDDAKSDTFSMLAVDVPSAVDHGQGTPSIVVNQPSVSVTNQSVTHRSLIEVLSTTQAVPASNTSSTLAGQVTIAHTLRDACPGSLLTDVAPQENRRLCVDVTPTAGLSTAALRRSFLLKHAGRQMDITTSLRQKAYAPATWASAPRSVTSRYQVKLPPPTRPSSDQVVCARTLSGGLRSGVGLYGRLYWAWPFAADSGAVTTQAVNRFVVIRSTDGLNWTQFRQSNDQLSGDVYSTAGNGRESISINSSHLANNAATPVFLSVRAYLYAGSSVYVDADWMVQVSEGETQIADYFSCRTGGLLSDTSPGVANPNSAPVGLN